MNFVIEVRLKGVVNTSYEATLNGVKGVFGALDCNFEIEHLY